MAAPASTCSASESSWPPDRVRIDHQMWAGPEPAPGRGLPGFDGEFGDGWWACRLCQRGLQVRQKPRLARSVQPGAEVHEAGVGLAQGAEVGGVVAFARPGEHL